MATSLDNDMASKMMSLVEHDLAVPILQRRLMEPLGKTGTNQVLPGPCCILDSTSLAWP